MTAPISSLRIRSSWSGSRASALNWGSPGARAMIAGAPRMTTAAMSIPAGSIGYRNRSSRASSSFAGSACATAAATIDPCRSSRSMMHASAKSPITTSATACSVAS